MAKVKRTHNDLQNTTQNTKDQTTPLQLSDDGRYIFTYIVHVRRVWRYQRGNQNPYTEGQATQWSKEKGQTKIYKIYTYN